MMSAVNGPLLSLLLLLPLVLFELIPTAVAHVYFRSATLSFFVDLLYDVFVSLAYLLKILTTTAGPLLPLLLPLLSYCYYFYRCSYCSGSDCSGSGCCCQICSAAVLLVSHYRRCWLLCLLVAGKTCFCYLISPRIALYTRT